MKKSDLLRRSVLFLAMLMSGGLLIFPRGPILALMLLLCMFGSGGKLFFLRRQTLLILLVLVVLFVVTLLRPQGFSLQSTVIRFANFAAGLLLLDVYLRAQPLALAEDLYAILKVLACQAIATVLLAELADFVFLPVEVNGTTYFTVALVFNYHVVLEDGGGLTRPDGFFYEPGVFQIYLNILVYLALFVFRSRHWAGVAILAVFCTQSTTGVVICVMLLSVFIATRYINRGSLQARLFKVGLSVLLLVPVAALTVNNVVDKLTGDARGSFFARQYDLLTGLSVIAESPVIGIGFDYEQYYRAQDRLAAGDTADISSDPEAADRGNTNGIVFLTYSVGIPLALVFIAAIWRQLFFQPRWLFGALLFVSFMGESMIFTPFFLMLIFSGMLLRPRPAKDLPLAPPVGAA